MSIPSTLISGFIGLASCGSIGSLIVNALWLMAVDLHRGGSISLPPVITCAEAWTWGDHASCIAPGDEGPACYSPRPCHAAAVWRETRLTNHFSGYRSTS